LNNKKVIIVNADINYLTLICWHKQLLYDGFIKMIYGCTRPSS